VGPVTVRRQAELGANLAAVRARIAAACGDVGRDPAEVTLIVVTKFFPASDVRLLSGLGVHDMGESRDQEAGPKFAEVRADTSGLRLHFIGQVQSNKAASVARYADVVHTVDRPKLVAALEHGAERAGRALDVLVQVDLDRPDPTRSAPDGAQLPAEPGRPESHRGGVASTHALDLAEAVAACAHLRLAGVMAVAPLHEDPDPAFARLARTAAAVRARFPDAVWISAGMSGDLEAAVRHGATHLRVGTAILGSRPPLR